MLNVRVSTELEKYLGLPNVVSGGKRKAFQEIKDRLKARIGGWSIRHLSHEVKEIFIKSVHQAIPTYSMLCFLLPSTSCLELENIIANFFAAKE